MRKTLLGLLSILIFVTSVNVANAKVKATSPETAQVIKYYKEGNYVQSLLSSQKIVDKDPSNALAVYYYAMSNVQLGHEKEAIAAYDSVISMSGRSILGAYARKGKKCLVDPSKCHEPIDVLEEDTWEDRFIKGKYGSGLSKSAREVHEREKMEHLKREINKNENIAPATFKEYKDYSSYAPTNDEIVEAIRTLQRAGLSDTVYGSNYGSDVYNMLGAGNINRNYEMLNMLYSDRNGVSNMNPQLIQSLLSTQMSANF